ncbi:hypothetical protein HPB48_019302 [Haemaphysalis longicornis]|uniref:Uncharacterized protein n=1 Tax=Haemaphysalis longicornis TaxID=44386 RepID=A0A9J6GJJ4_HAELO|nr:hypothetical protein HPB48_019302 [Haemaphysalis longicornis]
MGPRGVKGLQHQEGMKFCVAVSSAAAAKALNERSVIVNGTSCHITCIGPQLIYVTVYRFQWYMDDKDLGSALSPYGRVLSVHNPSLNGRPRVENGVRLVRMEMKSPVPHFLSVRGYQVKCEYRGVKRVCSRCEREAHHSDSRTPWCPRCETFGHEFETCSAYVAAAMETKPRWTPCDLVLRRLQQVNSPNSLETPPRFRR